MSWTDEELRRIDAADELEIAPVRRDGTLRRTTPIWAVRAGDDLFVRAAYGPRTGWHRVARASGRGRIRAGGVERDVRFEDAGERVNDDVDAAYQAKYGGRYAGIVGSIVNADARASTLRIVPDSPPA
jgi:hypothetical protein